MASDRATDVPDYGDDIDPSAFEQILEMDDDDDSREFSGQIVFDFFQQADDTFRNMDTAIGQKELEKLSELGHFLKGSSATLGLIKVKDSCEKIQNWGKSRDAEGHKDISKEDGLKNIKAILPGVKSDCAAAEKRLKTYYAKQGFSSE